MMASGQRGRCQDDRQARWHISTAREQGNHRNNAADCPVPYLMRSARHFLWVWLLWSTAADFAAAANAWELSEAQNTAVRAGDVVVVAVRDSGTAGHRTAMIHAAVLVRAPVEAVFKVMTDCPAAPSWVPHLVSCAVLESDSQRGWDVIAHEVDYGWFAPRVRYVFRASYTDVSAIRFEHVSGDFETNEGIWALTPVDSGAATLVTYRVRSRPKMYVPNWLYERSIRAEIPGLLKALRERVRR